MSTNAAVSAIKFAMNYNTECPLEFLRCWMHGDFQAIRDEWPEAPDSVFVGADISCTVNTDDLLYTMEQEIARLKGAQRAAKMVIESQEKRLTAANQKQMALDEAVATLDSEREMNAVLSSELEASVTREHIATVALDEIASQDCIELVLDPQWPVRIARGALRQLKGL